MPPRRTTTTGRPDSLEEYRAKRDFSLSPEPSSSHSPTRTGKKTFVIQKHDARTLHYDVRLEIGATMMSWAVPKGPSFDPNVKRLAVEVEDHPLAYASFEGTIPDGPPSVGRSRARAYGAGLVEIWDRGTYETDPPNAEEGMRAKGHFKVTFHGEKMKGAWHIVRTPRRAGGTGKHQWLMFKSKDETAHPKIDIDRVTSAPSGRTARELLSSMGDVARASNGPLPGDGKDFHFEIKFDGYRLLAGKSGGEVRLFTRKQNDWTDRFKGIVDAVARLPATELVIDGEACAVDASGRPSFEALQQWLAGEKTEAKLAFAVFDLLFIDGRDVRRLPLEERREILRALLEGARPPLSFSTAMQGNMKELLAAAKHAGLEGLVAKRRGSPYVSGPTTHWIKLKFELRQECVIVGYTPMSGTTTMGALVLGLREEPGGPLVYGGKVGTGFDTRMRHDFARRLDAARTGTCPILNAPRGVMKEARWSEPSVVCEIAFVEWTRDGSPRHPRFLGMREDKAPEDCIRDRGVRAGADLERREAPPPVSVRAAAQVKLSNPDKVLYPRDGITKKQIFDYYTAIAPVMVPHLRGRPINMQRWPDGIDEEEWFQHRTPPKAPDWVRRIPFEPDHDMPYDYGRHGKGVKERVVVENVETLQWIANLAALTIHAWGSHAPAHCQTKDAVRRALGEADYVCIDLDPGESTTWAHVIQIAHAVRTLFEALHLESYPKTSGKRGLHIILPIARGPTHDQVVDFGSRIAAAVAKVLPDIATIERTKDKRRGRCYVDYGQNGEGRTLVAPYSLRAVDGAPVSTPLLWSEVTEELDPRALDMKMALKRVEKHGDLFAPCLTGTQRLRF